jgi:hypothetical protein
MASLDQMLHWPAPGNLVSFWHLGLLIRIPTVVMSHNHQAFKKVPIGGDTSGMEWTPKVTFFIYWASFFSFRIVMHARHILWCCTKVTFLCGKSPNDSDKSHLQNPAFFPFHCNCVITFYICFVISFTSGTLNLGIYSMQLYHFLEGVFPPFTTPLFWKSIHVYRIYMYPWYAS